MLDQQDPHPLEAGADSALHRAFWLPEDRGHLSVGPSLKVRELYGLPLTLGKALHSTVYLLGYGEVPGVALNIIARVRSLPTAALLTGSTRRLCAQNVDGPVVRERDEIGSQAGPRGVEAFGLAPETEKDILRSFIG